MSIYKNKHLVTCMLVTSLWFAGCAQVASPSPKSDPSSLPPITEAVTGERHSGKFVWHDLITDDIVKAKQFYAGVFGWTFEDKGIYTTIYHKGKAIGGMIHIAHSAKHNDEAIWLPSISVKNVDSAIVTLKANQGRVLKGPIDMLQRGRGALVSDAQGAQIVLLHSKSGDPLDATPNIGDWLWNELWTTHAKESETLYRKLGQYDTVSQVGAYRILKHKGKWRAGIREISKEDTKSRWVSVVRVADLQKSMAKVISLGGHVLMKPHKDIAEGQVAVITDNTGALLLLQRWSGSLKEGGK